MSPGEFVGVYGTPVPMTRRMEAGESFVIPADPERYLLVLWGTGGDVLVRYGDDPQQLTVGFTWHAVDPPITFSHAVVGSLVASALTVGPMAARQSITYLVGRMVPIRRRPSKVGGYRGKEYGNGQGGNGRR